MDFSDREVAYILACLRICQDNDISHMPHFEDNTTPLSSQEVNELCERISCEPIADKPFTAVGVYPDYLSDGDVREASFVVHVTAKTVNLAAREARLQGAKNRLSDGESKVDEEELAQVTADIAIIAIFEGHIMDHYDPDSEMQ